MLVMRAGCTMAIKLLTDIGGNERYMNSCRAKDQDRQHAWGRERVVPPVGSRRCETGVIVQREREEHSRKTDGSVVHQVHPVHEDEGFARRYCPCW